MYVYAHAAEQLLQNIIYYYCFAAAVEPYTVENCYKYTHS